MAKRWTILPTDEAASQALQASLKIHPLLCQLLVQRGIKDYDSAKAFFRPNLADLHDPYLLKDMGKAVERLLQAFDQNEKILVFGDYDVDGTTAVAAMVQFLQGLHPHIEFYIPHRYREGYGLSQAGIDFAAQAGFTVLLTLDCGIKSVELVTQAQNRGIDCIICDHHLPDAQLPPAVAILNPKQKDCPYPYKELCGCGVGFKLMMALAQKKQLPAESYTAHLDLVAIAIAADIVPLTGENRVLAYHGLQALNAQPRPGIKALLQAAQAPATISLNGVVFLIAPRINAAGRMDDARKAVSLFLAQDEEEANALAALLHSDNADRKDMDKSITDTALEMLQKDPALAQKQSTVVYDPSWHKGVVGIVASRLIETWYRPTVVLTQSGGLATGSARSVVGFNLYEAIHACRQHLTAYGGHFAAAGLSLLPENIPAFTAAFEQAVRERILPEQLVPELLIDGEIRFADISPTLYKIIAQMEPFGPDNMKPVWVARGVTNYGSKIVKEMHLRLVVKQEGISLSGIGFNLAHRMPVVSSGAPFDVVFTLDENEWQGQVSLQMKVLDLRPTTASSLPNAG